MRVLSSALVLTLILFNGAGAFASNIEEKEEFEGLKKQTLGLDALKLIVHNIDQDMAFKERVTRVQGLLSSGYQLYVKLREQKDKSPKVTDGMPVLAEQVRLGGGYLLQQVSENSLFAAAVSSGFGDPDSRAGRKAPTHNILLTYDRIFEPGTVNGSAASRLACRAGKKVEHCL